MLCHRIVRHLEGLFVFVTEPGVHATNNAAERSLRHLVISRHKIALRIGRWSLAGRPVRDRCGGKSGSSTSHSASVSSCRRTIR